MLITDSEIVGYKNFKLANIKSLKVTFTAPLQLILGSNGSGKSSFMSQLTPMPAVASDFEPGGYTYMRIEDKGNVYELRSDITKGAHHSFVKNEVEMNEGGTALVQKDLVESELGFTPSLQKLLTGKLKLSNMGPTQIMKVLSDASDLNLDYANSIFDKVKEKSRDSAGALKHIRTKIADVQTRLSQYENIEELNAEAESIRKTIQEMIPLISFDLDPISEGFALDNTLGPYGQIVDNVYSALKKDSSLLDGDQIKVYSEKLEKAKEELAGTNALINQKLLDHEEILDSLGRLKDLPSNGNLEQINEQLKLANHYLATNIKPTMDIENPAAVQRNALDLRNRIEAVLANYSSTKVWTRTEAESLEADHKLLTEDRAKLDAIISKIDARLNLHNTAKAGNVTCKSCGELNYAEGSLSISDCSSLEEKKKQAGDKLDEVLQNLSSLEEQLSELRSFKEVFTQLKGHFQLFPEEVRIADIDIQRAINNRTACFDILQSISITAGQLVDWNAIVKQKEDLEDAKRLIENSGASAIKEKGDRLTIELEKLTEQKSLLTTAIESYRQSLVVAEKLKDAIGKVSSEQTGTNEAICKFFDSIMSNAVKEAMSAKETQLASIVSVVNNYSHLEDTLKDLQKDEANLLAKKRTLDILSKELSPKVGLIAQQMRIFLEGFFAEVNSIVKRIFDYDIEIRIAKSESALDYKFPIFVNGKESGEITTASDGQKDVFDLAFTLVLMSVMDLQGYPLYLDEMGATFDDAHRENLVKFIKSLLETGQVDQIFMISHYTEVTGGLANNESLVLHADNMTTVPSNANRHAILE